MKRILYLAVLVAIYEQAIFAQTGIRGAQAMFIYNFSRLVEWPPSYKSGPFIIGVFGSTSMMNEVQNYVKGKSIGQQKVIVNQYDNVSSIDKCHILFVAFAKTKDMTGIVNSMKGKSTLIITEKNGGIDVGSAINFKIIGDKLKFEIKPSNATKYGLKISAKLEEMAVESY